MLGSMIPVAGNESARRGTGSGGRPRRTCGDSPRETWVLNSLELLEMAFLLEREFGIDIPSDELLPDQPSPIASAFPRDGLSTAEDFWPLLFPMPSAILSNPEARQSSKTY